METLKNGAKVLAQTIDINKGQVPQPKLPYLIHVYSTIGDDGISISLSSLPATN